MSDIQSLLTGSRGRRFLLELALLLDAESAGSYRIGTLGNAVYEAAHSLDPNPGVEFVMVAEGTEQVGAVDEVTDGAVVVGTAESVGELLAQIDLLQPTDLAVQRALSQAVSTAYYWQEPDGVDVVCASPPVARGLERVVTLMSGSQVDTQWWSGGVLPQNQWSVAWEGEGPITSELTVAERLRRWRAHQEALEQPAKRPWPWSSSDASGEWWSAPSTTGLLSSTGTFPDGSPVGVWLVEDALGWEEGQARKLLEVPTGAVHEIHEPEHWAALCRNYPLDVTHAKQADWFRVTGRRGRWVMPDWERVAQDFTGVHLSLAGYLSAACQEIPVAPGVSSVIAGWNPDQTFWFVDGLELGQKTVWTMHDHGFQGPTWVSRS
ncbi:hypothetical protein [Kocuria sp.]|uniref:hypothetical protein n=1 Tax=Kocuria sp. TaxID=1871328 RepID=UPI0026DF8EEF|nr:hypothetical protein [Kocuria sp.]MDO5619430.1 hypothetical protein [Kocuria sp.]